MKKHTPGPWKLYDNTSIDNSFRIMHLNNGEDAGLDVAKVRKMEDAYLIAAAPELLQMLKVAVNYFEKNAIDGQDLHVHEMRAIINKAEGRSE